MKISGTRNISIILILYMVSLLPLINIIGNLLPPILGFKLNWIYHGITLMLAVIYIFKKKPTYVLLIIIIPLFGSIMWYDSNLKNYIEILYGLCILYVVFSSPLEKIDITKVLLIFRFCLLIPLAISLLQYFDLLPLQFMHAQYVNIGISIEGLRVERVNGFYYHGIELAIAALISYVLELRSSKSWNSKAILFIVYYFIIYITFIKTALFIYIIFNIIILFKDKLFINKYYYLSKRIYRLYFIFLVISSSIIIYYINLRGAVEFFELGFLTGRGVIWNIYLTSMLSLNPVYFLYGYGFGSSHNLFELGIALYGSWFHSTWIPHEHNVILGIIISGGLIFLLFTFFIMKKCNDKFLMIRKHKINYYSVIFALLFIILGFTHPIHDMSLFWVSLSLCVLQTRYFISKSLIYSQ